MYSKICAINVVYFWDNLSKPFSKIHGLLKASGRFVIFMSSPERLNTIPFAVDSVFNKYPAERVKEELCAAGFAEVTVETMVKQNHNTYYICADKR